MPTVLVTGADRGIGTAVVLLFKGLATHLPPLRNIVAQPGFAANKFHTRWLEQTVLPAFQQDHA